MNLNFEIEKLRAELKHVQEMYAMAQTETVGASQKVSYKFLNLIDRGVFIFVNIYVFLLLFFGCS